MDENLEPIRFQKHLQQAIDHDEYGHPRENIPAIMDSHGWDLKLISSLESSKVSEFEKACAASAAWVGKASRCDELVLLGALRKFDPKLIAFAAVAIEREYGSHQNPLKFALTQPFPIRLTLLVLALLGNYGSGGEAVNIASGLPPKPPAPGHWGGRTPGFEQPLPTTGEDLDVGDTKHGGR